MFSSRNYASGEFSSSQRGKKREFELFKALIRQELARESLVMRNGHASEYDKFSPNIRSLTLNLLLCFLKEKFSLEEVQKELELLAKSVSVGPRSNKATGFKQHYISATDKSGRCSNHYLEGRQIKDLQDSLTQFMRYQGRDFSANYSKIQGDAVACDNLKNAVCYFYCYLVKALSLSEVGKTAELEDNKEDTTGVHRAIISERASSDRKKAILLGEQNHQERVVKSSSSCSDMNENLVSSSDDSVQYQEQNIFLNKSISTSRCNLGKGFPAGMGDSVLGNLQQGNGKDNECKGVSTARSEASISREEGVCSEKTMSVILSRSYRLRDQVVQLSADLDGKKEEVRQLQSSKDALQHEVSCLRARFEEIVSLKKQNEEFKKKCEVLDQKNSRLMQYSKDLRDRVERLSEENLRLESELSSIRQGLADKTQELEEAKAQSGECKRLLDCANKRILKSEEEKSSQIARIDHLTREKNQLEEELKIIHRSFDAVRSKEPKATNYRGVKNTGSYAFAFFVLSGAFAIDASLTIPYLAICIPLALATLTFLTAGCCCLYKANTALSGVEVD